METGRNYRGKAFDKALYLTLMLSFLGRVAALPGQSRQGPHPPRLGGPTLLGSGLS